MQIIVFDIHDEDLTYSSKCARKAFLGPINHTSFNQTSLINTNMQGIKRKSYHSKEFQIFKVNFSKFHMYRYFLKLVIPPLLENWNY